MLEPAPPKHLVEKFWNYTLLSAAFSSQRYPVKKFHFCWVSARSVKADVVFTVSGLFSALGSVSVIVYPCTCVPGQYGKAVFEPIAAARKERSPNGHLQRSQAKENGHQWQEWTPTGQYVSVPATSTSLCLSSLSTDSESSSMEFKWIIIFICVVHLFRT